MVSKVPSYFEEWRWHLEASHGSSVYFHCKAGYQQELQKDHSWVVQAVEVEYIQTAVTLDILLALLVNEQHMRVFLDVVAFLTEWEGPAASPLGCKEPVAFYQAYRTADNQLSLPDLYLHNNASRRNWIAVGLNYQAYFL